MILCIITPSLGKFSETFIENHINFLHGSKLVITLNGGVFANENGKFLGNHDLISKSIRFIKRLFFQETFHVQQIKLLKEYLLKHRVGHVLIEYGITATKTYQACIEANIPFTVHFHGYDAYIKEYANFKFYREVFKSAHKIVAVSEHMRQQLISIGADATKIEIVPCGSDFQTNGKQASQRGNLINFLAVGRFVEKKAPYLTVLAFAEALKKRPDLRLTMVGDGVLMPVCQNIVNSLNIAKSVIFTGALKHEEVRTLMENCDAFIQHSIRASNGDSEGLPVAIIEALSLKKPVLSTLHAGIPEIVIHGENGLLTKEGDVIAMAENILKAADGYEFNFEKTISLKLLDQIEKLNAVIKSQALNVRKGFERTTT